MLQNAAFLLKNCENHLLLRILGPVHCLIIRRSLAVVKKLLKDFLFSRASCPNRVIGILNVA